MEIYLGMELFPLVGEIISLLPLYPWRNHGGTKLSLCHGPQANPSASQKGCIVFEVQHPEHGPSLNAPYLSNSVCVYWLTVSTTMTSSCTPVSLWSHPFINPIIVFYCLSHFLVYVHIFASIMQKYVLISRIQSHNKKKNCHLQTVDCWISNNVFIHYAFYCLYIFLMKWLIF